MNIPVSRVTRSKESAKASYDKMSRWYDFISGNSEKKYRDLGLLKLAAQPGERILEIGFGTGHCLQTLAEQVGKAGRVYGIDLSEGMLSIAQERLRRSGLDDRADLRCADAASLPLEAASLDGIFMSFTLELFDTPEIPLVLAECQRVLRPGGRIVVVSLVKKAGTAVRIYEWFHEKMPDVVDCRPILAQDNLVGAGFTIAGAEAQSMWGLPVEIILANKKT
jgi:demethylmenaquinone methyltransferase/2-methoxy-6-polyprenyl-1,4-benzoquinol methylase